MAGLYGYAYSILCDLPAAAVCRVILAGGALRSYFDRTKPKDFDLFFRSEEEFQVALDAFRKNPQYIEKGERGRTYEFLCLRTGRTYNLIGFAFGTPEEHIRRFDFRCCAMAAWFDSEMLVRSTVDEGAVEDATSKRLVVVNNNGTDRTERRIAHYIDDYGYSFEMPEPDALDRLIEGGLSKPMRRSRAIRRALAGIPQSRGSGY